MKLVSRFLATTFLLAAVLFASAAQAMSVRQYESEPIKQRSADAGNAIRKIVADVAKVNRCLAGEIYEYFWAIPPGQPESPGLIAFEGDLVAVENLAAQGKFDLDKVQIEGILLGIIKRDVMPKFAKNAQPSMGSLCVYEGTVDSARQSQIYLEAYSTAVSETVTQLRSPTLADGKAKTSQRLEDDRKLADVVVENRQHALTDAQSQALHDTIEQYAAAQPNTELKDVISSFLLNRARKQLSPPQQKSQ